MKQGILTTVIGIFSLLIESTAFSQNVGVGTGVPDSKLHVAASSADSVALKVSIDNNTRLKVAANGGVSIGGSILPPANGLIVKGMIQPEDSIKTDMRPIYITSVNDSVVLQAGSTTIILSANGAVKIKASGNGGISIDGGTGDVSITGANVNIKSSTNTTIASQNGSTTITASTNATLSSSGGTTLVKGITTNVQGSAQTNVIAPLVRIGASTSGSYLPAARQSDVVSVSGSVGTIITGSSGVLIQ